MPELWRMQAAARMTRTLERKARRPKIRRYLETLPKRDKIVVSPEDYPAMVVRPYEVLEAAAQALRDARRYAEWEARGKPPSPSAPRKDRLRPRGRDPLRARLYDAQRGLCGLCGYSLGRYEGTIDHVVPRALGGKNANNVLLAHERCNSAKADRPPTAHELATLAVVNALLTKADRSQNAPLGRECESEDRQ